MIDISEHRSIAQLYAVENTSSFGKALFQALDPLITHELIFIAFLPIKFELASLSSKAKYQKLCDHYIRESNKYDLWLKRSPIGPSVKCVRHSDYTSLKNAESLPLL